MSIFLCAQFVLSQNTVTGNVLDNEGVPLPGATILIEGTSNGTTTDFDGNFSILVQEGQSVSASYVGYKTSTIDFYGQDQINFSLSQSNQLDEVVVTALGVEKEAAQLGYAISKVNSDKVVDRPEGDIGRLLRGKAAGVNITSSNGLSGSSTNITKSG